MALPALTLWVLTADGSIEVWMVYALVLARGHDHRDRQPGAPGFVIEMVGPDRVVNAVALNWWSSTPRASSGRRSPAA